MLVSSGSADHDAVLVYGADLIGQWWRRCGADRGVLDGHRDGEKGKVMSMWCVGGGNWGMGCGTDGEASDSVEYNADDGMERV